MTQPSVECRSHHLSKYCTSRDVITNGVISEFACASDPDKCPTSRKEVEINIDEAKKAYNRTWQFDETIPSKAAADWHCKYIIRVKDRDLIKYKKEDEGAPMIVIEVEHKNFDKDVWLITQPHGKFRDFGYEGVTNMFQGLDDMKMYFPAEYDILVSFAPTESYTGVTHPNGHFKLGVKLVGELNEDHVKDINTTILVKPGDTKTQ